MHPALPRANPFRRAAVSSTPTPGAHTGRARPGPRKTKCGKLIEACPNMSMEGSIAAIPSMVAEREPADTRKTYGECQESGDSHRNARQLWGEPVEHARERRALAHVLEPGEPGERALDADAESRVRHAPVAAQVLVPLERRLRQAVLVDAPRQQIEARHALAAADDLAVALGGEAVARQDRKSTRLNSSHVEISYAV